MRSIVFALLFTASASAETVGFHVKLTDARTALLANPQFEQLKISDEQLEHAAKDRVLLLDRTRGTRWTWLMLRWPEGQPVEHGLNTAGTAALDKAADVSLTPVDTDTFSVRCLREECALATSEKTVTLKKDQSVKVRFDSDLRVELR